MFLDHIVHFVKIEPEKAVEAWKSKGFHAAIGGSHLNWGTRNALFYLKDSYIEWLAIEDLATAEQADHPLPNQLLHDQIGFGTVCLRTEEIDLLDQNLQQRGVETSGVLDAERKTEAGKVIKWKMLFIKEPVSEGLPFPFFIEWGEDQDARYQDLRERDAILPENETLSIECCVFGVKNPALSATRWREILGTLELPNCRFEFIETRKEKERLEKVILADGVKRLVFEDGVYCVPPCGNI